MDIEGGIAQGLARHIRGQSRDFHGLRREKAPESWTLESARVVRYS